ncbi:MAG: glutathione-disulfide reductase [Elainellaceae cyanobacterium]
MAYDYDLVVIGAGSGGLAAAKRAAQYDAKVAIVEREQLGGVCVNRGCVPKKLMVYASDFAHLMQAAKDYGWQVELGQFHWQEFVQKRDRELERLRQVQAKALAEANVTILRGHASFHDDHTLMVDDRKVSARHILIAVGSQPVKPPIPGIEHTITSREMFHLPQPPERLAIIGGGYIGVEFASMMQAFGSNVTILNVEECILANFDQDLSSTLRDALLERGIQSLCNTTAKQIQPTDNGLQLSLSGKSESFTADVVLCATGRRPQLEHLELDRAGIELDGKAIAVDGYCRTSQPHIFAIGDCIARLPLTPVANAEGRAAADTLFGDRPRQVRYDLVPTAVFARPEAASVGMTEASAREKLGDQAVQCSCQQFRPLFDTLTQSPTKTLIKWVMHRESKQILGCHIVGKHAAEIIQGVGLAMQKGITQADLEAMIPIHPSSAEELFGS